MEAAAQVLRQLRMELFRTLLMQRIEFFDRHATPELTALLSSDLDSLRSFVFSNVSRDRGLRAILEAVGSVLVNALLTLGDFWQWVEAKSKYSCSGCLAISGFHDKGLGAGLRTHEWTRSQPPSSPIKQRVKP